MKHTLTLLTALLLAPLAAVHAADAPKPPASADDIAKLASNKPSGIPLGPILDPGPEFADEKRLFSCQPNIAVSPKGRIWLTWDTGGRFEGDREATNYSVLFTSGDGGKSFQGPVAVARSPRDARVMLSTVWIDPQGRLWWYYLAHGGTVANIADDPEAAKPNFQAPFYVTSGLFGNIPTVLADGSWFWIAENKFPSLGFYGLTFYRSQDEGRSFSFVGSYNFKPDTGPGHLTPGEPWAVELRDGRIALFLRTAEGAMKTISADGGRTWGKEDEDSPANGTSASVGLAGRIMRSNRRSWLGRMRPDRRGAAELSIHAQGRIFVVGADRP